MKTDEVTGNELGEQASKGKRERDRTVYHSRPQHTYSKCHDISCPDGHSCIHIFHISISVEMARTLMGFDLSSLTKQWKIKTKKWENKTNCL